MMKCPLSAQYVRELLSYDKSSGLFTWIRAMGGTCQGGNRCRVY